MACIFILLTVFRGQNFVFLTSLFLPAPSFFEVLGPACLVRAPPLTWLDIQSRNLYKVWVITSFFHRLRLYRTSELNSSPTFFHLISRFFIVLVCIAHLFDLFSLGCILVCSLSVHVSSALAVQRSAHYI